MLSQNAPATRDFQLISGSLALDFVNTVGNRLSERRDYFQEAADVNRWARLAGLLKHEEVAAVTTRQLESLRSLREYLYHLFCRLISGGILSVQHVVRLNQMTGRAFSCRQLCIRQGQASWSWRASADRLIGIRGPILLSASELLASDDIHHLRQCADKACGWLFLDRSQGGKRVWCSMADCGNRAKAQRHYQRSAHNGGASNPRTRAASRSR